MLVRVGVLRTQRRYSLLATTATSLKNWPLIIISRESPNIPSDAAICSLEALFWLPINFMEIPVCCLLWLEFISSHVVKLILKIETLIDKERVWRQASSKRPEARAPIIGNLPDVIKPCYRDTEFLQWCSGQSS